MHKKEKHPCGNCVYYGDECMEYESECEFSEGYTGEYTKSEYEEEMPLYKFRMIIGDWGGDGHCKNDTFTIESNKPVQEVREAHFKIAEITGIDVESICSDFEDAVLPEELYNKLDELGFNTSSLQEIYEDVNGCYLEPEDLLRIWIFLLWFVDNDLCLTITVDPIECLQFYGYDKKKRKIGQIGYGLYY